jgi:hypothetical protein
VQNAERFPTPVVFFPQPERTDMRACFLGQNVTALGFGVAMLQTQPLPDPEPAENPVKDASDPQPTPAAAQTSKTPEPA